MAAGDIIFEDGTIITPADLEKLIPLITNALGSTAKDPSEYPILERLDDLTSLPVFDAAYNLGRVSILRLKGVNGKNAILRVQGDMLQWSLEGTDIWNDLYSKSELKGDPGAAANMEIGEVTSGDTPAATITGEAPNYKLNLVLVPGGKGDAGDNGKTPVLTSVSAQSGETASGSFTDDGVDESGNPKYILNLTLPKGQDGQPAVFQQGTTTTLNPSEEARVEVIENGLTPEGNPKYLLNFFIPRGQMGPAGTGSGNVSADGTGLVIGKKYLFVPNADGSTAGTFVEYTPPGNATAESAGLMTSDQFQKLEKLNPSYLSNDVTGKKVKYTDDGKLLFEGKETFSVDANNELTLAGKKLSELGGGDANVINIPPDIMRLSSDFTSDEIFAVWGGQQRLLEIVKNFNKSTIFTFGTIEYDYKLLIYPDVRVDYRDDYNYTIDVVVKIQAERQVINVVTVISEGTASGTASIVEDSNAQYLDLSPLFDSEGSPVAVTTEDFINKVKSSVANHVIVGFLNGVNVPIVIQTSGEYYIISSSSSNTDNNYDNATYHITWTIQLSDRSVVIRQNEDLNVVSGYGTKFKSDNGTYKEVPIPSTPLATTSANGLMSSADKTKMDQLRSYTISTDISGLNPQTDCVYVNLNSNQSLSAAVFGNTYNGYSITAFVYTAAVRTITIPTTGNYVSMCGSSYTTKAGKWVEFNLKCIDGKWHIAKLEQE